MRLAVVLLALSMGCGKGDGTHPIIAKEQAFQRQVCACRDAACVDEAVAAAEAWRRDNEQAIYDATGKAVVGNPVAIAKSEQGQCAKVIRATSTYKDASRELCACADAACAAPLMGAGATDEANSPDFNTPVGAAYDLARAEYLTCAERWADMLRGAEGAAPSGEAPPSGDEAPPPSGDEAPPSDGE